MMKIKQKLNRKVEELFHFRRLSLQKLTLSVIQIIVFSTISTIAQTSLAKWEFTANNGAATKAAYAKDVNISSTNLATSFGSGLSAFNYFNNGFTAIDQTENTQLGAITGNDYISFKISPIAGKSVTISSIRIRPVSQNRVRSFSLFSSKDGFANANVIATVTFSGSNPALPLVYTVTNHTNITIETEFRIYIYGYTDNWESTGLGNSAGDDLEIIGNTANIVGGGPAGYTLCSGENQTCTLNGMQDIAYGANGVFNYLYSRTGSVACNNGTFGDPISGVAKSCYVKNSVTSGGGPAGYTLCSTENQTCTLNGMQDIAYGANGVFNYLYNRTGSVACSNGTFGDPISGVAKSCYVKNSANDTQAPSVPTGLASSSVSQTSFTLNWTVSADNVGVTGYEVFRNATSIGTSTSNTFAVTGLAAGISYNITVRARDAAGNWSAQSNPLAVTTNTVTRINNIGININGAGGLDYNTDKPWADAMRSHRSSWSPNIPRDANGWQTQDGEYLVYTLNTSNNHGTYKLYFNGQATLSAFGGVVSNVVFNSATNTSTADVVVSDVNNDILYLRFSNTKRTTTSATNTGVTNIKLMRPISAGSSTSYPPSQVFTDYFLNAIAQFQAIRFMDWTATNTCGDSLWADRTLWSHASQAPVNLPNRTYGWQGRGASWESVIMLANTTGKDAWICIPHKATDDYITKLANLFRYGSDGVNPYTSTQTNPIFPPLNSNLKLYVEYSNEVWNWSPAFAQTPWICDKGVSLGMPMTFDGETDRYTIGLRYKAVRSVQISEIFRSVFGSSNMMSKVRPVLQWQQGYTDLTFRTLSFLDRWYNKRDSRSTVATAQPINYYFYSGGGSAYWDPGNNTQPLDINNIWTQGRMIPSVWEKDIYKDAVFASTFGFKHSAYEGGGLDGGESLTFQANGDNRIRPAFTEHHKAWNHLDGDLLMYFNLSSGLQAGLSILKNIDNLTTPKWYAMLDIKNAIPENVSTGMLAPFTREGVQFDTKSYEGPNSSGLGAVTLSANTADYATGYCFRVNSSGVYNLRIQYRTSAAASLAIDFGGNELATFSLPNSNNVSTYTTYMNLNCNTNKLNGIRLAAKSGTVNIEKIIIGSGALRQENDQNPVTSVSIYPNPAHSELNVSLPTDGDYEVGIYNLQGALLYKTIANGLCMVNTSIFPKGMYFVKVKGQDINQTTKFVIE